MTNGEIISSKMQESLDVGAMYQAYIRYKYAIGEKEYFSNQFQKNELRMGKYEKK